MTTSALTWDTLDWGTLDRLRDVFLSGQPSGASYWTAPGDLENYDLTYAQRIGWKWDAVLRELLGRGWTPPPNRPLLDWGCGSGIAGRRVIECFGPASFDCLRLVDRSPLATEFAAARAAERFPNLRIELRTAVDRPVGILVLSHVLNELDETGRRALRGVIDLADAVLWVEPGAFADSRALIAMREELRDKFLAVAPCTHQAACGLGAGGNERHWCHHFAPPPPGIMADSDWVRFAQRAGIDLRRVPYSFLVLERRGLRDPVPGIPPEGHLRIIGEPRLYKGFARVFRCRADGVHDVTLQKRDAPDFFRALRKGDFPPVQASLPVAPDKGKVR